MPTKSIQIRYNHTEGIRAAPHPLHQTPPGKLGGGPQGGPGDRHLPTWSPKPLKNHLFWSRGWSNRCSHNEIYDIGTEILLLTKNDHNSTQNAPKSIIPEEIKSAGHFPSSDSVKSRFKALFKKWPSWICICCFSWIFAPRGRLNHEAYNVEQCTNSENIKNKS